MTDLNANGSRRRSDVILIIWGVVTSIAGGASVLAPRIGPAGCWRSSR